MLTSHKAAVVCSAAERWRGAALKWCESKLDFPTLLIAARQ